MSLAALILAASLSTAAPAEPAAQLSSDVVPVGVRYDLDPNPVRRRTDLENMRRLRFNVVAVPGTDGAEIVSIDRLLAGDPNAPLRVPASDFGVVPVTAKTEPDSVREGAWTRLGAGSRGVIFDDWRALQQNDTALAEAGAFAENLARNPALYTPLRRVDAAGDRALKIDGGQGTVDAHWLESDDALMLIAVNHAAEPRQVTLTFPLAVPEAIWQNMLTGGAVNFVAGPTGPIYERRFAPHDVLVLMIRKRWK